MENKLNINVRSFSYKREIPKDLTGNGGGYVFDCRGILNPGRIEEYKSQTGRDPEVIQYLEEKTRISEFLQAAFALVDLSIEDYIERGFENLDVNFGCTGGQHRSVYSADAMAKHIKDKFPQVQVSVQHVIQEEKEWKN